MAKQNWGAIALLFVGLMLGSTLIMGGLVRSSLLTLSPISAYQGIHPSFVAVYHEGGWYSTNQPNDASVSSIGPATMNFDPDHKHRGHPNLQGELRDIQIVRDLAIYEPGDAYTHIINQFGGDPQPLEPYRSYEWEVIEGDEKHIYKMDLWLCSMEINLWAKPDPRPFWELFLPYEKAGRYRDSEVWLRLETSNEWGQYFEGVGVDNTYFGLGYVELAQITGTSDDEGLQVIPMAKWSAFDVYETLGGTGVSPEEPDSQAYEYQGATLNPAVFKKEWFTKVTLSSFGCYDYNALDGSYKADSVNLKALVHVFVVGEWIVKPEEERDLEEHEPPWKAGWFVGTLTRIDDFISDPFNRLKMAFMITLIIVVVIVVFFPQVPIRLAKTYDSLKERDSR
jgi:hypothetical protein